jgi:hypothetical protein
VEGIGEMYTGLEAQSAINMAVADYVKIESETAWANIDINRLWQEETAANLHGLSDALSLTSAYNAAVASFHELLKPQVSATIQLAFDGYSLYQAAIPVARSGALGVRLQSLAMSADDTIAQDLTTLASSADVGGVEVAADLTFEFGTEAFAVDVIAELGLLS